MIRLSLLHTSHARTFQRSRLRSFCPFYGACNLLMCRSRGFGPQSCNLNAILRLAFATAPQCSLLSLAVYMHSPVHYAKGTPSHIAPEGAIVLRPLVSVGFQVLLTQLIAVLFTVQSPYLFTIGHRGVFSLGRWSGQLHTEFHELRATLVRLSTGTYRCRIRDFHPLW